MDERKREMIQALWDRLDRGEAQETLAALAELRAADPHLLEGRDAFRYHELYAESFAGILDAEGVSQAFFRAAGSDQLSYSQRRHYSDYLFALHYLPNLSAETMAEQHRVYAKLFKGHPRSDTPRQDTGLQRERHIRIGVLSPGFGASSASLFTLPLVRALSDRGQGDIHLYDLSGTGKGQDDETLAAFRALSSSYDDVSGILPERVAEQIQRDSIDIFFDFGGHTAGGSAAAVVAEEPAPVIVSGIGYFDTTGLRLKYSRHYILSDAVMERAGGGRFLSEMPLALPHMLCFSPRAEMRQRARGRHAERNLRFGVFQNFLKVNEGILAVYRKLMDAVPTAELILQDTLPHPERAEKMRETAAAAGLPMERVTVRQGRSGYLDNYAGIDIMLDTFPYPGGAMTAIALYMGVPVVTLAGGRRSERFGASILSAAGCGGWIARSEEEYVEKVLALAKDREALWDIQQRLREKIERSPLMQEESYGEELWKRISSLL